MATRPEPVHASNIPELKAISSPQPLPSLQSELCSITRKAFLRVLPVADTYTSKRRGLHDHIYFEHMALLALNHDVLFEILSQTDSRSALNLSMVSRKAYDLSLPQALSDVTLSRSQNQVRSFCQFILADLQNRLPYLRQLTIECTSFGVARHIEFHKTVDFSAASDIAELLAKAKRLNRLSIACFEGLIAYEPRISIAVCGIPDLADLALHNCGHLTVAMLPSLRSRPRRLAFTSLFNRSLPSFFHRLIAVDSIETLELSHLSLTDGSQPHEEIHEIPCMPSWNVVCPVRQVQLDLTAFHYPDALSVIRHTSPVVLSLPMETKLIDTTFWGDFITATPRLRYLEVCLDEGRQQKLNDWMTTSEATAFNSSPLYSKSYSSHILTSYLFLRNRNV
ncbi:hypothetical protein IEO21_10053 [Rhodonia placenta]|uniref:F-box domain-containing protein n=1 Tax=Rhodonia placenta TaxID=104341 RepID=A0A8H7NT64_9APHY|nr:hypothetical protein IEO21_10053 [Postia placenta]